MSAPVISNDIKIIEFIRDLNETRYKFEQSVPINSARKLANHVAQFIEEVEALRYWKYADFDHHADLMSVKKSDYSKTILTSAIRDFTLMCQKMDPKLTSSMIRESLESEKTVETGFIGWGGTKKSVEELNDEILDLVTAKEKAIKEFLLLRRDNPDAYFGYTGEDLLKRINKLFDREKNRMNKLSVAYKNEHRKYKESIDVGHSKKFVSSAEIKKRHSPKTPPKVPDSSVEMVDVV